MGSAFARRANFNGDISGWDTSAVTSMHYLFDSASAFNQDISQWDTSKVTDMLGMFNGASAIKRYVIDVVIKHTVASKTLSFL